MGEFKMEAIKSFFKPSSVAIIGASAKKGKVGNVILNNIIYGSDENVKKGVIGGFKGGIYPINPKVDDISGLKAYDSIIKVPSEVDMAVISIPADGVKEAIEDCGKKGVKSVVIITAGFSEMGAEGQKLEEDVLETAKKYNIRIIGPNCLGIISPFSDLNASFGDSVPKRGPISFASQSGALCTSVIQYSFEEFLGFSNFVSIGNKADVDDADLIEYFHNDPNTKCIMLYIESLRNARKFFEIARKVVRDKPIVAFKSGFTEEGAKATSSHTGSIAGSDLAYEAAFRQSGIFRAKSLSELFDASRALAYQPVPNGENIAILTNAGGPGVLAADQVHSLGMKLAHLGDKTIEQLNEICPPSWSHRNPVDIIGDSTAQRYDDALKILMNAEEIDAVIVLLSPTAMAHPLNLAYRIVDIHESTGKPITVSFVGIVHQPSENYLDSQGIPEIEYPERAVFAMYALMERYRFLKKEELL
ncbi:MAG: CoA-binding protein [Thermoplasmata archaeon]|nr:MAG: CoA-binding protein [Thermoplasmata archaeon]